MSASKNANKLTPSARTGDVDDQACRGVPVSLATQAVPGPADSGGKWPESTAVTVGGVVWETQSNVSDDTPSVACSADDLPPVATAALR